MSRRGQFFWTVAIVGLASLVYLIPSYHHHLVVPVIENCEAAETRFGGDCVEALIAVLQARETRFEEKNRAVWTLARLGDRRALPVLRGLYSGQPCHRPCQPSQHLCQYELEKAIYFTEHRPAISHLYDLILDNEGD